MSACEYYPDSKLPHQYTCMGFKFLVKTGIAFKSSLNWHEWGLEKTEKGKTTAFTIIGHCPACGKKLT